MGLRSRVRGTLILDSDPKEHDEARAHRRMHVARMGQYSADVLIYTCICIHAEATALMSSMSSSSSVRHKPVVTV